MNNLLQSLSNQRLRLHVHDGELKRLLSAVKDGRGHDAKLSDAFYDSLEGVLLDLRTVTIDNHDAEAFLKPVSKTDYPDYYEIIKDPMDLQTMLRKVKQKQYKSKREFQDDLELIWSNCFVYNTGDNHPLRQCAKRLQAKANRLLKNITDRRDRLDPPVPVPSPAPGERDVPVKTGVNGVMVNGHGHGHGHSRKHSATPVPKTSVVIKKGSAAPSRTMSLAPPSPPPRREMTFGDQPAFVRTAAGMSTWAALDRELELLDRKLNLNLGLEPENGNSNVAGPSRLPITEKLRRLVVSSDEYENDVETEEGEDGYGMEVANGDAGLGDKRKLTLNGDVRPRKRARTRLHSSTSNAVDPVELWWEASTSSSLMANALPIPTYSSSFALEPRSLPPLPTPSSSQTKRKAKKKKKRPPHTRPHSSNQPPNQSQSSAQASQPKRLLGMISNNIRTLRRVRQVHDKFVVLNMSSDDNSSTAGPTSGAGEAHDGLVTSGSAVSLAHGLGAGSGVGSRSIPTHLLDHPGLIAVEEEKGPRLRVQDVKDPLAVDDRPWRSRGTGIDGLELGERDASDCLRWMGMKVLEHSGFQSTSKAALDVFTGVATEYLFNVGRTLRYLCDKYSKQMSAEEIILHTLFESGITHIRDLERYITEDIVRYGSRLTELEKKLTNAYNEVAVESALDDDAFFNEDEEEDSELVMGNFAEAFGDDFLGLRELGIASELGLQSLTIPKRLLRGKNKQRNAQKGAKPSEPPPPYPPPPPFTPLDSLHVDSQIGLLRPSYISRFNAYATRTSPSAPPPFIQPPAPAPSQLEIELAREMGTEPPVPQAPPPVRNLAAPVLVMPDDPPPTGRTKSGPLGQIMRPSASAASGAAKKKVKSSGSSGPGAGSSGGGASKVKLEGVHGPAGPGPGIAPLPPPSAQAAQLYPMPNGFMQLNGPGPGPGHLPGPMLPQSTDGYAVLPGSAGTGDGGKKNANANPNASPKKKTEPGGNGNGFPAFVVTNA